MIKRDFYIKKLIEYKDKDLIKIITGIRRCGKSFLLFKLFYDYLKSIGINSSHILLINLESIKNIELRNPILLYKYLKKKIIDKNKYYIFIDEIQLMEGFEDLLNGLKSDFNCDIYITGSNSKLLSSEINTKLRGRGIEIKVFPLSFQEFLSTTKLNMNEALNEYITFGGLPYLNELKGKKEKIEYLRMINNTVVTKDIIDKYSIRNQSLFISLLKLMSSQIGSIVSPNKISQTLKSNNYKTVDNETISNYIKHISDAFLFYETSRYDIKGKEYLKSLKKYYICDLGLRNEMLNFNQLEMSHIMENLVYIELLRRGYIVHIGKNVDKEIDFVVDTYDDKYYIQVCLTIENEKTRRREFESFRGLDDGYKKILITKDDNPLTTLEKGYKMLNLYDFLTDDDSLKKI